MSEENVRKCKCCGEEKTRRYVGKYPNNRDKKWEDDDYLLWNGNVCGKCNVKNSVLKMRKLRDK